MSNQAFPRITPSKINGFEKGLKSLSASRKDDFTTQKSKLEPHNDEQKTSHKRSANYCKNEASLILKESQWRIQQALNMPDQRGNNQNLDSVGNTYKISKNQQAQFQESEHRIQIEKLLLEISRLHDVIHDLEKIKKHENQKIREDLEHISILQLNNIRQSHSSQLEILEQTLKTTRDRLADKTDQYEDLFKNYTREKQIFKTEIQKLQSDLKEVVDAKNNELFSVQEETQLKTSQIERNKILAIEEMRDICEREVRKMGREMEEREKRIKNLQTEGEENEFRHQKFQRELQQQKEQLERKLEIYIQKNNLKYEQLTAQIKENLEEEIENRQNRQAMQRDIFDLEIQNLLKVVRIKDEENQRNRMSYELQILENSLIKQKEQEENQILRQKIERVYQKSLQEIEQLKLKMAFLHQNDISQLVKLYETKIDGLMKKNEDLESECQRNRKLMHEETHNWYVAKKDYERKISQLNVDMLKIKSGMDELEREMKDKLENERSAMMITSRQLIKGAELKSTNEKFNEDELRKLRQIIERKQQQIESMRKNCEANVKVFENENKSLIENVRKLKEEQKDLEQEYLTILEEKCKEIKKLNKLTHDLMEENQDCEGEEVKLLKIKTEQQQKKLEEKSQLILAIHNKVDRLEKELNDLKSQNEHLHMENQINHNQVKDEYEKISHNNLATMKNFYDRRIKELESDKQRLQNKLSAQNESMCQLIKRYQQLEGGMKEMVKQAKKRTKLEEKIMLIGLDNNLVRNKVELFEEN